MEAIQKGFPVRRHVDRESMALRAWQFPPGMIALQISFLTNERTCYGVQFYEIAISSCVERWLTTPTGLKIGFPQDSDLELLSPLLYSDSH